ncbi:MAG: YdcF family protein [Lachnospiraceae bacterium]|nr:YdcF family protein [Lachnospiraceae bacterium]
MIQRAVLLLCGLFLGIFSILVIKVIIAFRHEAPSHLPYIIVLGAQMKKKGPSLSLQRRLDAAITYLRENDDTIVILSGGQGTNEPMAEAEGMARYMRAQGIDGRRMRLEDRSVNTYQNLCFSRPFISGGIHDGAERGEVSVEQIDMGVGIVTSNFHIYRALKIAGRAGYRHSYGIPSRTENFMLPSAITREVFAIIKDFVTGHL